MKILPTLILYSAVSVPRARAFLSPISGRVGRRGFDEPSRAARRNHEHDGDVDAALETEVPRGRRDFLRKSLGAASLVSAFPSIARAVDDVLYKRGGDDGGQEKGDMTSQLFNPDGSLRDPNTVVEVEYTEVNLPFLVPSASDGIDIRIATDGVRPASSAADAKPNLNASYKLPLKWNRDATSQLPLYYDSSEGKNGKSCNRITVYSVSAPDNLDITTLEKASRVGVAKSLFMDRIPNGYFDRGVSKADLIGGRTARKPILSAEEEGEYEEQVYYEFDIAFAPVECPDYKEGNKENLGLGFCPYDKIYLVSATVLKGDAKGGGGTLVCCIIESDKVEWKMANSELKRARASFTVDRDVSAYEEIATKSDVPSNEEIPTNGDASNNEEITTNRNVSPNEEIPTNRDVPSNEGIPTSRDASSNEGIATNES